MSRDILIDVCGPMTRVALVDSSDIAFGYTYLDLV